MQDNEILTTNGRNRRYKQYDGQALHYNTSVSNTLEDINIQKREIHFQIYLM